MKRIYLLLTIVSATLLVSCSKYVDTPLPKNELVSELVFTDDKTAIAAVTGLYADINLLNYFYANVLINYLPAIQADDLYYFTPSASFDVFQTNTLLPNSQYVERMWRDQYSYIYHTNACIEGLTAATGLTPAVKDQLLGEAYFMRAFLHFYLVNMYGDVPLITSTDYLENNVKPREKADLVYAQIIKDLTEAKSLMGAEYPTGTRVRPNKGVATALLARVYLYVKQYALAEQEATAVLQDGQYELLEDLNSVFLANSREALFQLQPVNLGGGRNTWEGFASVPATPTSTTLFRLDTTHLIDKFEAGDKRLANWTGHMIKNGANHYYPYKYKVRFDASAPLTEYSMVMRVAEQYLIRAEARIQQEKFDLGRQDLDSIRHRAGLLPLSTSLGKPALLLAVEKERKMELFCEWGHRWFDLKRTNRADAVLGPIKGANWQPQDTLYPIPSEARRTNINLTQNDGYN